MAAITIRVVRPCMDIHPALRVVAFPCSSSSDDPNISQPSFSLDFKEVKASLEREKPNNRPGIAGKPLLFRDSDLARAPLSKIDSLEEIRSSLAECRLRSPASASLRSSGRFLSFQELRRSTDISSSEGTAGPSNFTANTSSDSASDRTYSFDSIREKLRQLHSSTAVPKSGNVSSGKIIDPMPLSRFKETLRLKILENTANSPVVGGDKESMGNGNDVDSAATRSKFVRSYDYLELGRKLEILRPKQKGKWFSLRELSERLAKLREIEEENNGVVAGGLSFTDLGDVLSQLKLSDDEEARKKTMQRLNLLSNLGGIPSFILSSPKEHLVEKYLHPEHMSAADKLKLELKIVRDEFKMSESDCGSTRVQVAELTTKIKYLSTALQKKDKHSRKGLQVMVQRRKKLLKYLRRTDWHSYTMVTSKLGLRNNPNITNHRQ